MKCAVPVLALAFLPSGCVNLDAPTACASDPKLCADAASDSGLDVAPEAATDADASDAADGDAGDAGPRWLPMTGGPLAGRANHSAVWTGTKMMVWGGFTGTADLADGAEYDPSTDSWAMLPAAPIGARSFHGAVWTGDQMMVWGGGAFGPLGDGAMYAPSTKGWGTVPASPLSARTGAVMVWCPSTGEVVIWGGGVGGSTPSWKADGAAYSPISKTWRSLPTAPIGARGSAVAVWTGSDVVIWGGQDNARKSLRDGARYSPSTNSWTVLPDAPTAIDGRAFLGAAASDKGLVFLWGGFSNASVGGTYDRADGLTWSATDGWKVVDAVPSSLLGAPQRDGPLTWWAFERFWVWSGGKEGTPVGGGASYDPVTRSWSPMTDVSAPAARTQATVVFTGKEAIIATSLRAVRTHLCARARRRPPRLSRCRHTRPPRARAVCRVVAAARPP